MENRPLVSVVMATFNEPLEFISSAIESILTQTYKNIEHIIIDGNSTDRTLELIKEYDKENKLKIFSEKDSGIYDAMNKGLKQSKGKYIVYLNSDDFYCRTNAVEEAVMLMEKNKLDYLFGDAKALTEEKKEATWIADINNLPYAMNYCHQTLFVKSEIMKDLGGFDLKYKVSADSDVMIKLYIQKYKYGVLRNPYITYRLGGLSSEQSNQSKLDHSESFYINIGRNIGLTKKECEEIWAMRFTQFYPLKHQLYILRKLSKLFDTDEMVLRLIMNYNNELSLKQSIKRIGKIVFQKLKNIVKIRTLL